MTEGKFPNGLMAAMKDKPVGPTELGRLVGETKQDISRWAKQERRLVPEVAAKIAPHVNKTVQQLLLIETDLNDDARPTKYEPSSAKVAQAIKAFDELDAEGQRELMRYAIDRGAAAQSR